MNIDFISLVPGAFGQLVYSINAYDKLPADEKQKFIDSHSRETMNAYMQNDILGNPNQIDPITAFNNARAGAEKTLREQSVAFYKIDLQIGNDESMKHISEIELNPNFVSWEDPIFVKALKEDYNLGVKLKNYPI